MDSQDNVSPRCLLDIVKVPITFIKDTANILYKSIFTYNNHKYGNTINKYKYKFKNEGAKEEWSLSQERVHVEDLITKRLTSFLAIFASTFWGIIFSHDNVIYQLIISVTGWVLCAHLGNATRRAQVKFDIIMAGLKDDESHPIYWTERVLVEDKINSTSARHSVGLAVPHICCLFLCLATIVFLLKFMRTELLSYFW